MAVLAHDSLRFTAPNTGDFHADMMAQYDALDDMIKHSRALPDGEVVGAVLAFQVADGYAHYLVVDDAPLTVQHIAVGDGYAVNNMMIKGMDREDVLDMLAREKRIAALFANRA